MGPIILESSLDDLIASALIIIAGVAVGIRWSVPTDRPTDTKESTDA